MQAFEWIDSALDQRVKEEYYIVFCRNMVEQEIKDRAQILNETINYQKPE